MKSLSKLLMLFLIACVAFMSDSLFAGNKKAPKKMSNAFTALKAYSYTSKIKGRNFIIYNAFDTTVVKLSGKMERFQAKRIRSLINEHNRSLRARLKSLIVSTGGVKPSKDLLIRGYFVIEDSMSVTLDRSKLSKLLHTKTSVEKLNGHDWFLFNYTLRFPFIEENESYDSTNYFYLKNLNDMGIVQKLVPFEISKDSLINYLNDTTSTPKWTEGSF